MPSPEHFQIPDTVRELAERNLEQARNAYDQMMEVARQAQQLMQQSQDAVSNGALEVQHRAVTFAEENMRESFDHAMQLARASDMHSALQLQQQFAQSQVARCAEQTREMTQMMLEVARKMQGGR